MTWELTAPALLALMVGACSGLSREPERCPEGQIATVSGCLPVPQHDGGSGVARHDAGARDSAPDAASPADADQGPEPDAGMPDPDPMDAAAPDAIEPAQFALGGDWALEISDAVLVTSQALGNTESVTITTLARLALVQNGTSVEVTTEVCAIESTPFAGFTTITPRAAVASIELDQGRATLSNNAAGATFTTAQRAELMGWRALLDAATERMPGGVDDLRLVDGDQDQNPGVTLSVSGPLSSGEMYVATRAVTTLDGTAIDSDHLTGLSRATRERTLLGASNDLLAASDIVIETDPDPAKSIFHAVRLPGMVQADCDSIIRARGLLFP